MLRRLLRERREVRELVRDVGAGELRLRHGSKNCRVKAIPLCEKVFWAVGFGAESSAETIRLVADLKGHQPRTQNLVRCTCLAHRIPDGTLPEVESVKAGPVRRVKELAEIAERECRGNRALLHGLRCVRAEHLKGRRTGRHLIRVGGVLAGATAKSEIAPRCEFPEDLDESVVLRRKEVRVCELGALVGQTNKLFRNC